LLAVGQNTTLTPSIVPPDAHNQNVTWESSDNNVATVDNGKVTGIALGKATITVTTEDGGRTAKCFVSVVQPIEPEMVKVDGGTFTMGCTNEQGDDCFDNETPSHQVTLSSFYIAKTTVTQKEWIAIMGNNPSYYLVLGDNIPVNRVSWDGVQDYIAKLNALTGKNYRLPTEAEWEFAARGGNKSEGYKYSGSNNIDEVAWYSGNSGNGRIHPVGQKAPNELGLYDMSGNIWEWCSDWYGNYSNDSQNNPAGAPAGSSKVTRGGSIWGDAITARVSWRFGCPSNTVDVGIGFRLVHP
jgi:formylglycine-generating enzyme required for sulfatase activity